MPPRSDHLHKLKRHTYKNKEQVYFCAAGCGFRVKTNLALGLLSECWRCHKPFTMSESSIRLAKPHCADCTKRDSSKEELVDKILSAKGDGDGKGSVKKSTKAKGDFIIPGDFREQLQRTLDKVVRKDALSTETDDSLDNDDML